VIAAKGEETRIQSTFRDPQGKLYFEGQRVLRTIYPEHEGVVLAWLRSGLAQRWIADGYMIGTQILEAEPLRLEHQRISFPSYPWEWTPGQWKAAALLTLDMCEEALREGYIIKDATPLNLLFSGPRPVFVDVLSFELREPRNPIWTAYAQFVRTFLLPLAAYAYLGWPLTATMQRRDGYEPSDLAPWLPIGKRWRSPLRSLVTVPLLLQKQVYKRSEWARNYRPALSPDAAKSAVLRTVRSTRRILENLQMPRHSSRWSGYPGTAAHYHQADHCAKQEFVRVALAELRPSDVLDIGANTGVYSRIAANSGAQVVAWDTDVQAAEINWQTAAEQRLPIQVLVADFARPVPPLGWCNSEYFGLLDRAKSNFDLVMMLGVIHHVLVTDQIPLPSVIDQLSRITRRWLVIEWIPRDDSQFVDLCRGRESLYEHLDEEYFSNVISSWFTVRKRVPLPNGRTLFLLEVQG